jgi:hypothetical protein
MSGDGIARYREFLEMRDGEVDLVRRRLPKREAFLNELERKPVRASRSIDREAYLRGLNSRRVESALNPEMLWLLATAKANQGERFGVGMAELFGRIVSDNMDPAQIHVALQESYHTRILAEVIEIFGLPVYPRPPRVLMRLLIHLMVNAPEHMAMPLIGASELAGCALFHQLRDRGIQLFADESPVAERIGTLYNEILGDEIGHVGFIAARLSEIGRAAMRRLYLRMAPILVSQVPELTRLFGHDQLMHGFASFNLSEAAAELPTLAFPAALI